MSKQKDKMKKENGYRIDKLIIIFIIILILICIILSISLFKLGETKLQRDYYKEQMLNFCNITQSYESIYHDQNISFYTLVNQNNNGVFPCEKWIIGERRNER